MLQYNIIPYLLSAGIIYEHYKERNLNLGGISEDFSQVIHGDF
jgi:hypothetical protein